MLTIALVSIVAKKSIPAPFVKVSLEIGGHSESRPVSFWFPPVARFGHVSIPGKGGGCMCIREIGRFLTHAWTSLTKKKKGLRRHAQPLAS
jgi:hypothetical protein